MKSIPFIPPAWDVLIQDVNRSVGIPQNSPNRLSVSGKLPEIVTQTLTSITPCSTLRKTSLTGYTDSILSGEEISIASSKLGSLMSDMDHPACIFGFALTLGEQIDTLIAEAQKASMAEALILDATGTFLAEHYASLIENHLRQELGREGLGLSARFSPGCCDWDLQQGQTDLFQFLLPHRIGISLLASSMMSPLKSITGIFIAARSIPHRTPCSWCSAPGCRYRR